MKKYLLVLAVAFVTLGFQLQEAPSFYSDEARVCETVRNMFRLTEFKYRFILPYYAHEGEALSPRLEKPPLVYWMIAASVRVLGDGMLAFRLPSALLGILTVLLTVRMGYEMIGEEGGVIAGMLVATSYEFVNNARLATYDIPLTFFVTASALFLYWCMTGKGVRWLYAASAAVALGVLVKGPYALLFPVAGTIAFGLVSAWRGGYAGPKGRQWFHLIPALLLFILIAAPWFVAIHYLLPVDSMAVWFYETLGRSGHDQRHHEAFYYYLVEFPVNVGPWTILVLGALWAAFRERDWLSHRGVLYALCWFGAVFVLLQLNTSKRESYLLPVYPLAAILGSYYLTRIFEKQPLVARRYRWPFWLTMVAVALGSIGAPAYFIIAFGGSWWIPCGLALALIGCSVLGVDALRRFDFRLSFLAILMAAMLFHMVWFGVYQPIKGERDLEQERIKQLEKSRVSVAAVPFPGDPGL